MMLVGSFAMQQSFVKKKKKKKSRKENYDQSNAQCLTFSIFLTKEDLKNKMFCFLMEKDNRFSVWLRAVQDRHVWLLRFYYISLDQAQNSLFPCRFFLLFAFLLINSHFQKLLLSNLKMGCLDFLSTKVGKSQDQMIHMSTIAINPSTVSLWISM